MNIYEVLRLELGERSYDITVGEGLLGDIGKLIDLDRRILIVTDSGVPKEYSEALKRAAKDARIFTFPEGEASKNIRTFEDILSAMLDFGMQRSDAVVAVVSGDIAGFAAACYMRGIDFYNIPTTLLSQVDSSIGGKTAIDFHGVKNIIGAFYQPRAVVIDTAVLSTLEKRHISAGMAEIIKMALTSDKELFELIESACTDIKRIIVRALKIKKAVVEADEREAGIRRVLNFGHTYGHGIEALGGRLHGECVALGMLPMCSQSVRERLIPVLQRIGLPTRFYGDKDEALRFARSDKKGVGESVYAVTVENIGEYRIEKMTFTEIGRRAGEYFV